MLRLLFQCGTAAVWYIVYANVGPLCDTVTEHSRDGEGQESTYTRHGVFTRLQSG